MRLLKKYLILFSELYCGINRRDSCTYIPIIILQVLSADDSAYFYIAFSIASVLFMIPSALSTSLYAEGCVQESTFRMNKKQAIKQAYLMLAPALAIIIFFGDKLLLLFGKSYSINGHFLLTVLAISSLFMVHSSFYITYLKINLRNMEFEALTLISTIGLFCYLTCSFSIKA
jgi:O-antigen/teichoic acid export membrane protein